MIFVLPWLVGWVYFSGDLALVVDVGLEGLAELAAFPGDKDSRMLRVIFKSRSNVPSDCGDSCGDIVTGGSGVDPGSAIYVHRAQLLLFGRSDS